MKDFLQSAYKLDKLLKVLKINALSLLWVLATYKEFRGHEEVSKGG